MLDWGFRMRFKFLRTTLFTALFFSAFSFRPTEVGAWYRSAEDAFTFCKSISFENPVCPPLTSLYEVYAAPSGPLTNQSLLLAATALKLDRSADSWLDSLKLNESRPKEVSEDLWNQARWLYAQSLYSQRRFQEASVLFTALVGSFKRRSVFHQQRAWVQYFNGELDKALGSVISAESPLTDRAPFPRKYLLKALIERDTCQPMKALQTIVSARTELGAMKADAMQSPFVKACNPAKDGDLCGKLIDWFNRQLADEISSVLKDLDFLEAELSERNSFLSSAPAPDPKKAVEWSFVGEAWLDELGHYTVQIEGSCSLKGEML